MVGVSENGWTTDELGLLWPKRLFGPSTQNRTVGKYRLLILDRHGSHVTAEFDQYCTQNSIIVLCMPPHSSHLLPSSSKYFLLFGPKRSYGLAVQEQMRAGINYIEKDDFLDLYLQARAITYNVIYQ
jgi:hypothetical protein